MEFALIHGEERLAGGDPVSDVDLVVGQAPRNFLRQSVGIIRSAGLRPVCITDYDAGGSATALLATDDGSDGVQLDLYFDPRARGRYGLRTGVLLEKAVGGRRWPVVAPADQLVYLIRKRQWKGDTEELRHLIPRAESIGRHRIEAAVARSAIPVAAYGVRRVLDGQIHAPFRTSMRHWIAESRRRAGRLRRPVGFWVELIGPERRPDAHHLATRFGRYLQIARSAPRPLGRLEAALWSLRIVAPVRFRPGIFVSYSTVESSWPRADLVLSDAGEGTAPTARRIVAAMEQRLRLR